jgi:hypothetical protein
MIEPGVSLALMKMRSHLCIEPREEHLRHRRQKAPGRGLQMSKEWGQGIERRFQHGMSTRSENVCVGTEWLSWSWRQVKEFAE